MDLTIIRNINQIIERDNKDTTYKFALLRGVIDSIQEFSHYSRKIGHGRIEMKTGILVFKWLQYYYPIISSSVFIPQKNGETQNSNNLAFRSCFLEVTNYYDNNGGMSVFINDIKKGQVPDEIHPSVTRLMKSITNTIIKQPMCYLGRSITNERYGIFCKEQKRGGNLKPSLDSILSYCGSYSIPDSYYEVFEYLGGFISGRNSILIEWANFTVNRQGNSISHEYVLKELLKEPVDKRMVNLVDSLYREKLKNSDVHCVWSGKKLSVSTLNIDHILPFSAWKNNDLWNLIPVDHKINNQKRDSIPSPEFVESRCDQLFSSWMNMHRNTPIAFRKDVELGLLGIVEDDIDKLLNASLHSLKEKCSFLIEKRGMPAWEIR